MRRRSPERVRLWRDMINAWRRSSQTVSAFCGERKITRSNFDRWRRILATKPARSNASSSAAFVTVRVVADPMAEVVLRSGVVVRLPLTSTPEVVTRLVAAVGAAAC